MKHVVENTDKTTLQGFVNDHAADGATLYTDEVSAYKGIDRPHEAVNHSVGEYVRDQAQAGELEFLLPADPSVTRAALEGS